MGINVVTLNPQLIYRIDRLLYCIATVPVFVNRIAKNQQGPDGMMLFLTRVRSVCVYVIYFPIRF